MADVLGVLFSLALFAAIAYFLAWRWTLVPLWRAAASGEWLWLAAILAFTWIAGLLYLSGHPRPEPDEVTPRG